MELFIVIKLNQKYSFIHKYFRIITVQLTRILRPCRVQVKISGRLEFTVDQAHVGRVAVVRSRRLAFESDEGTENSNLLMITG